MRKQIIQSEKKRVCVPKSRGRVAKTALLLLLLPQALTVAARRCPTRARRLPPRWSASPPPAPTAPPRRSPARVRPPRPQYVPPSPRRPRHSTLPAAAASICAGRTLPLPMVRPLPPPTAMRSCARLHLPGAWPSPPSWLRAVPRSMARSSTA